MGRDLSAPGLLFFKEARRGGLFARVGGGGCIAGPGARDVRADAGGQTRARGRSRAVGVGHAAASPALSYLDGAVVAGPSPRLRRPGCATAQIRRGSTRG